MADENEAITHLRQELLRVEEQSRQRNRRFTMVFVVLSLITVSSIVYGFVNQVGAMKSTEEALRQRNLRDKCALEAQQLQLMVEAARSDAESSREKAVAAMAEAEKRIAKCEGKKK